MTNHDTSQGQAQTGTTRDWLASMNAAIQAENDPALWEILSRHHDQVEAHNLAAAQIARIAYKSRNELHFAEMFAVPVIDLEGSRLIEDEARWKQASFCIDEVLNTWLPARTNKKVFANLRSYDWVSGWRFSILRTHLQATVPGRRVADTTFLTETIQLPPEAPRLGFILLVLDNPYGWPQLPEANTLRDNRLKSVISFALQSGAGERAPLVLTPDRLQHSMTDSLCLWLTMLHEAAPILGWQAAPALASHDVVKVTLHLDHQDVPYTQFVLRKHQVSLPGVASVLQMLASIAPRSDHPMDLPQPPAVEKRLLLT